MTVRVAMIKQHFFLQNFNPKTPANENNATGLENHINKNKAPPFFLFRHQNIAQMCVSEKKIHEHL